MSTVRSALAEPPEDVARLRAFPAAGGVALLHRLSEWSTVWWYASVDSPGEHGGDRFDLSRPRGTCYVAESLDGALVEKLLRTPARVVVAERLAELFHAKVTVRGAPPTADLTARAASGFGLDAEVHSTLDYRLPRRWAAALWAAGWRGLRYLPRGDASGRQAGRALFGGAGLHSRAPAGMATTVQALDVAEASRLLEARGVQVRPIPAEVPVEVPRPG